MGMRAYGAAAVLELAMTIRLDAVEELGSEYHERLRGSVCLWAGTRTCYIAKDRIQGAVVRLWIDPQENLYKI